jgi:sirohydrochlorin cobaltochelatase
MATRLVLIADGPLPEAAVDASREACAMAAALAGEPVEFWRLGTRDSGRRALDDALEGLPGAVVELVDPRGTREAAAMSSAPFVWRPDGRPDWRNMWSDFCGLALFGGPPHRGPEAPLRAVAEVRPGSVDPDAIAEIRRGIWETTGLEAEEAQPGWLAIACESRRMAAWLCAAIILENVDALCEGERLLVPASAQFRLADEVKSIITVVAKTHHYWVEHTRSPRGGR